MFARWWQNKHFLFLLSGFAVLLFLYQARFNNGMYIDDGMLIFQNPYITQHKNPLLFWFINATATKAWPLTHSVYWLSYLCFGLHFWLYRLSSLLLHFTNGALLFHFLARRTRPSSAALVTSLFWLHPVAVESVAWISQSSTLLSALFFLLWLESLQKEIFPKKNLLLFVGMHASKSYGLFLPLLSFWKQKNDSGLKKASLQHLPVVLLTAYAAVLVSRGVYSYNGEDFHGQHYQQNEEQPKVAAAVTPTASITPSAAPRAEYAKDQVSQSAPEFWYRKIALVGRTTTYYSVRLISYLRVPIDSVGFYPEWNLCFFFVGLFVFLLVPALIYKKYWAAAAALLSYLPASGIVYVPFMKYLLVSDRILYLPLLAFCYSLAPIHARLENKWLRLASWFLPLLFLAITYQVIHSPVVEFPL